MCRAYIKFARKYRNQHITQLGSKTEQDGVEGMVFACVLEMLS
jgi:hypothetical protein